MILNFCMFWQLLFVLLVSILIYLSFHFSSSDYSLNEILWKYFSQFPFPPPNICICICMNSTKRSTFKHTKNPCSKKNSIENHWSLHQLHIVCIYFTKSTTTIKCEIIENILNRTENRKKTIEQLNTIFIFCIQLVKRAKSRKFQSPARYAPHTVT